MTETTIENITETTPFPIFKGAIYSTSISANTSFFTTDLVPTNTPTTFRVYYVGASSQQTPSVQRTNGTNVILESPSKISQNSGDPTTYDFIVGPNDTINFQTTNSVTVKTMIVYEVETAKGYAPIYS